MKTTAKAYVKIYGERNTGTNYLDALIRKNLPSITLLKTMASNALGWKHMLPNPKRINEYKHQDITSIITITKNPYSWLLSMYRKPYHYQGDRATTFHQFLKRPWKTLPRDNCPDQATPIHLWNSKNGYYLNLHKKLHHIQVICLTYEQLLLAPQTTTKLLAQTLNTAIASRIQVPNISVKGEGYTFTDYSKNT